MTPISLDNKPTDGQPGGTACGPPDDAGADQDGVLLDVYDLVTTFPTGRNIFGRQRGAVQAVSGVTFSVRRGEIFGLVGESGCGKSTVARTIVGLQTPSAGSVTVDGHRWEELRGQDRLRARRQVQLVFQDPFSSLNPRMTVRELLTEPWIVHEDLVSRERWDDRVSELLELVGLSARHGDRKPTEFSGGQLQRVSIARALALEPALLVADEAVSALDVSVQAQILNLLAELRSTLGLAILFISHDLSVVRHLCDRIAVMYLGKIVETGTSQQVYDEATHPYTQMLMSAAPALYPWAETAGGAGLDEGEMPSPSNPPSGCRFRTRCPKAQDLCAEQEPKLADRGFSHPSACHFAELIPR